MPVAAALRLFCCFSNLHLLITATRDMRDCVNERSASANLALMPIYEYRCRDGHTTDDYRSVEARHDPMLCRTCGQTAEKIISRVGHAVPDIAGYRSVVTGQWIGSRSTHRAHLREHGLIEVGNEKMPARKPTKLPSPREDILRAMETTK